MVDISITPANVIAGSNSSRESGTAGASILAGKVVVKNATSGRYVLADSNAATAAERTPRGIALHAAENGQPLTIHKAGDITIGATLVAGDSYYLSDTPGGICPNADVGATENVVLIGLAKSTTVIAVDIQVSGVTR